MLFSGFELVGWRRSRSMTEPGSDVKLGVENKKEFLVL